MGGNLQMLRSGVWHLYDRSMIWLSFDALKVTHRVTTVQYRVRYSVTLYAQRLTVEDWDSLCRLVFPIYTYNPESLNMHTALERASQILPKGSSVEECVKETPSRRFTLCVNGKSDFKQPHAEPLVQVVKAEPNMSVAESSADVEVPSELRQTIGSHLWLANMEASSRRLALKPLSKKHPNPHGPTTMTQAQLLHAQTQLEAASRNHHLTRMLKAVLT